MGYNEGIPTERTHVKKQSKRRVSKFSNFYWPDWLDEVEEELETRDLVSRYAKDAV